MAFTSCGFQYRIDETLPNLKDWYNRLPSLIHNNLSFYFSLYFEGSPPAEDPEGVMWWGRSPYISTFPCSHGKKIWRDGSRKFKNTRKKGTNQENSKKQDGKNGGKKKNRFLCTWRFPYLRVLHLWEMHSGPSCNPPSEEPTHMGTSPTT